MTNTLKSAITHVAIAIVALLMLSSFSSAQETILGNVAFYPSGAARSIQSNSSIGLGTHSMTCAQAPIWHDADIQKGQNPTIYNTTFGPCAVDGVLVKDLVLTEMNKGITLTIRLIDGKCFSLMLSNSAGIHLADLTGVGFKGQYKSNSIVGFNVIGTLQQ